MRTGTKSRLRILIAEDESIIRLDLREMLARAGYEVCAEASNGAEAVRLAQETEPDVAVLDVRMPEMTGIEAARRILAERPIPIVMLTAYADSGTVGEAVRAGAFAYVVKPFREPDLLAALETAVARQREWLESRRDLGDSPGRGTTAVEVVLGDGLWPLRLERRADGSLDVTPIASGAEGRR
ncbi:MAG: response regulator [Gaiellaceae bacterium]